MNNTNWTAIALGFAPLIAQILVWIVGILIAFAIPVLIPVAIIAMVLTHNKSK